MNGRTPRTGVLVMAHGTPAQATEIEAFYTRIRRGRPPTPEQLADLTARYEAIGGTSPLADRTRAQVDGIAARLDAADPGAYVVCFGAKHTSPSIEDAAARLRDAGVERVETIVLAPHRSSMGSEEYHERAAAALAGVEVIAVRQWYDAPGFVPLLAARVDAARRGVAGSGPAVVLFTAHSLPARVLDEGDPYAAQVEDSARLVADAAGVPDWRVGWQSAGRTPEPWLGPDVRELLASVAAEGFGGAVVCPVGFVADHLEVLYDLDVEAAARARQLGLRFARTASLNDDPAFLDVLAGVVRRADQDRSEGH